MNKIFLYGQLVFAVIVMLFTSIYTIRCLFTGNFIVSVLFGFMTYVAYNLMFISSVLEIQDELSKQDELDK